jgi:hypothetical protein
MKFFTRFVAALSLLFLAACPRLPQPFEHDQANALLDIEGQAGMAFQFESGTPVGLSNALRDALVRLDVPAFVDKAPVAAFPLRLKVRKANPRANTVELQLFWELYDADGLAIDHYDQIQRVVESDWDKASAALMKRLANEAAPKLAQMMPIEDGTKPSPQAAQAAKPRLFMEPVQGAPADGNDALYRAIRLSLLANGIEMAEAAAPDVYRLKGLAKVSKADAKNDKLHMTWTLYDGAGGEIAALDQEGLVAQGTLDRPWGPLAGEIVAGTAIELSQLMKQAAGFKKKP